MTHDINKEITKRVLVLDGAMGTMIQELSLDENAYRGDRFRDSRITLRGNHDLLSLTQPEIIRGIHEQYLEAGADIVETNTFNSNRISMKDYGLEDMVPELNIASARLAREAAVRFTHRNPVKPRFVAGSIGPTGKSASISPDVNDPSKRSCSFDDFYTAYREQAESLIDGGVDLLLVETVFDTLNAKAAMMAILDIFHERKTTLPVMVSVSIGDSSGRTLSGQTVGAFLNSLSFPKLFSIGLNCSLGAKEIRPYLEELSSVAPYYISVHPNAGLPDHFGKYHETPSVMAEYYRDFLDNRFANIIGGCCGTGPEHIRQLALLAESAVPRQVRTKRHELNLSGLEPLSISKESNFILIGERTNVSGSKLFARLIREEKYEEALVIARKQVENGASIIDVNVDDAMIDGEKAMIHFLTLISSEPDIAKVPVMIDSSRWSVIEAGLKCLQGKSIVNSISLKEGEQRFREHARRIMEFGAAAVVMAFDEQGQAVTFGRKTEICKRAYDILVGMGFPPGDIIFDPNILSVATGIHEHNTYAIDFLKATEWIKKNLPHVRVSGGISNLSYSFRGHDRIREAMHSAFLYHAIRAGMDMGIVNAGMLKTYEEIPEDLLELVEDVILNRREDATERLVAFAETHLYKEARAEPEEEWRTKPVDERLKIAVIRGISDHLPTDLEKSRKNHRSAMRVLEGPLMSAMSQVGELFGEGKMFLPQVVKSARVMNKAFTILMPLIRMEVKPGTGGKSFTGKVLLATVKGDVHDIGKNILSVILSCNNYEVIDLGVMVPAEKIIQKAAEIHADAVLLSGLITPSLEEMVHVAKEMKRAGLKIPLLIGGATTSEIHTAVKIDPEYDFPVVHVKDASRCPMILSELMNSGKKEEFITGTKKYYQSLRQKYEKSSKQIIHVPLEEARKNRFLFDPAGAGIHKPQLTGNIYFDDFKIADLISYIDWTYFFHAWKIKGKYPEIRKDREKGKEASKLMDDAMRMLEKIVSEKIIRANGAIGIYPCNSTGDDIEVYSDESRKNVLASFHFLRNQEQQAVSAFNNCLADFVAPKIADVVDYIGIFALTAGFGIERWTQLWEKEGETYSAILIRLLADRLAEAFAEKMHQLVRKEYWGYAQDEKITIDRLPRHHYRGIRPAPGYPACPDHSEKKIIFDLLEVEKNTGIRLTENFAMMPAASVCGFYFAHPSAKNFAVGKIEKEQVADYAKRKSWDLATAERLLNANLNY
jgi:5-methyltetrahydrofolate--homocysteine methyltransferase